MMDSLVVCKRHFNGKVELSGEVGNKILSLSRLGKEIQAY